MTYRPSPFQRGLAALNDLACVAVLMAVLVVGCCWLVEHARPTRRVADGRPLPQSAAILARLKAR